jgi:hypothetical protein
MPYAFYFLVIVILVGLGSLSYRYYYYGHAGQHSKSLCENETIVTGEYGRCIERQGYR